MKHGTRVVWRGHPETGVGTVVPVEPADVRYLSTRTNQDGSIVLCSAVQWDAPHGGRGIVPVDELEEHAVYAARERARATAWRDS